MTRASGITVQVTSSAVFARRGLRFPPRPASVAHDEHTMRATISTKKNIEHQRMKPNRRSTAGASVEAGPASRRCCRSGSRRSAEASESRVPSSRFPPPPCRLPLPETTPRRARRRAPGPSHRHPCASAGWPQARSAALQHRSGSSTAATGRPSSRSSPRRLGECEPERARLVHHTVEVACEHAFRRGDEDAARGRTPCAPRCSDSRSRRRRRAPDVFLAPGQEVPPGRRAGRSYSSCSSAS